MINKAVVTRLVAGENDAALGATREDLTAATEILQQKEMTAQRRRDLLTEAIDLIGRYSDLRGTTVGVVMPLMSREEQVRLVSIAIELDLPGAAEAATEYKITVERGPA